MILTLKQHNDLRSKTAPSGNVIMRRKNSFFALARRVLCTSGQFVKLFIIVVVVVEGPTHIYRTQRIG